MNDRRFTCVLVKVRHQFLTFKTFFWIEIP